MAAHQGRCRPGALDELSIRTPEDENGNVWADAQILWFEL